MLSFIPVLLFGAGVYGVLSVFAPELIRRRKLSQRASLSFDEIYRTSFQQLRYPRVRVEDVWNEIARDLRVDPAKIRPADGFGEELSVGGFPLVHLNGAVDARLNERLRRAKAGPDEVANTSTIQTWQRGVLAQRRGGAEGKARMTLSIFAKSSGYERERNRTQILGAAIEVHYELTPARATLPPFLAIQRCNVVVALLELPNPTLAPMAAKVDVV